MTSRATLGKLCLFTNGGTPKKSEQAFWNGNIPWITSADIANGVVISPRARITEEAIRKSATTLVPKGTVLLVTRTGIGKVAKANTDLCFSQDITAVTPDPAKLDRCYLLRFLDSNQEYFARHARGATIKGITRETIENLTIPLPPLEEQRRIAAILDKADALRQKRKQTIALLDSLTQSIFLEMFGDPLEMDRHQPSTLKEVAQLINGDRSKNYPSGDDLKAEGILFLNTKNIDGNRLNLQSSQFISEDKFKSLTRGKLQRGDLIITLRGTLGQCAIFDGPHETGFINAQMMIIRCNDSILPRFLREFLSLPKIQRRLKSANTGSAVPQLTAKQIGEISIPIPNLLEQKKYVTRTEKVSEMSENLQRHLSKLQSVFSSLQHRAFSGEL